MGMTVSEFGRVRLGEYDYLCFLLFPDDYTTDVAEQLKTQSAAFAQAMGSRGLLVQPFISATERVFNELMAKDWPAPIRERLATDYYPFLLVIRVDFAQFTPMTDQWALIWFREFRSDPTQVIELFGRMAKKIKRGEDVFEYLTAFARRDRAGRWASYFEFKPSVFGVSIDASAILQDLLKIAPD